MQYVNTYRVEYKQQIVLIFRFAYISYGHPKTSNAMSFLLGRAENSIFP